MFLKLLDTKTARVKEVKVSCDWSCTVGTVFLFKRIFEFFR